MRRMLERISPVLLVSVVAGGFVVASALPATADENATVIWAWLSYLIEALTTAPLVSRSVTLG